MANRDCIGWDYQCNNFCKNQATHGFKHTQSKQWSEYCENHYNYWVKIYKYHSTNINYNQVEYNIWKVHNES